MTEIIGVRFRPGGRQYYFDPNGLTVKNGEGVIVETGKGLEYGTCVRPNGFVNDEAVVKPLRPVVRTATPADIRQMEEFRSREGEAVKLCQQRVEAHGLDMKLVDAEYSFDGSKIVFFFTSDGRVDFRALVKDLAGLFRARIELRQIGVRDEARMLGGLGICGKPFCCSQFMDAFQPVSIKMAKTQNLSLNPTKISGACGRLMCCLKYEQDAYEDAIRRCPKLESFVECPDGVGTVCGVDLLRERVKVRLEDSGEGQQPVSYRTCALRVVRSGKGRRPEGYQPPPPEELEKLRYIDPEGEFSKPLGEAARLSAALEQYFGENSGDKGEEKRHGRRRRGKKPGDGQLLYKQEEKRPAEPKKKDARATPKGGKPPKGGAKREEFPKPHEIRPANEERADSYKRRRRPYQRGKRGNSKGAE